MRAERLLFRREKGAAQHQGRVACLDSRGGKTAAWVEQREEKGDDSRQRDDSKPVQPGLVRHGYVRHVSYHSCAARREGKDKLRGHSRWKSVWIKGFIVSHLGIPRCNCARTIEDGV
jgi:hypothetical protein